VTFAILAVLLVPACRLGQVGGTPEVIPDGGLATPTPTPVLAVGGEGTLPPGEQRIELELRYLFVSTVGSEEAVVFTTTIPLTPALSPSVRSASGEGEMLEDVTFAVGPVTAHNVADWIIKVDATLDPAMGAEPLTLHFTFTGQGYSSVQDVQFRAHMDAGATTHDYSLSLPLEEGATKWFDVEGWTDIQEWTVIVHLR
jgi:hypothetical protein